MDKNQTGQSNKPSGGNIFDVARPGAVPASPFGKPVITGNSNQVTDPMMSAQQPSANPQPVSLSDLDSVPIPGANDSDATGQTPAIDSEMTPEQYADAADQMQSQTPPTPPLAPVAATTPMPLLPNTPSHEPTHQLAHQQAFYGQMKTPTKKSKKVLIILLVLILLGGAAFAGYYFWNKQQTAQTPAPAAPVVAQKTPVVEDDELYTSKLSGFSLENLYDWKVTEKDTTQGYKDVSPEIKGTYSQVTFEINDLQKLVIDTNIGGRGGDCTPKATDKPFTKGNLCNSFKITKATSLSETNFPVAKLSTSNTKVSLINFQYMGGEDEKPFTMVGISNTEENTELNKEVMGLYIPYTYITLKDSVMEFKLVDADNKPVQLTTADLAKVEKVLKTLKLN